MNKELFKEENIKVKYNSALVDFLIRNKLSKFSLPNGGEIFGYPEGRIYLEGICAGKSRPLSLEFPLNQEGASRLYKQGYLSEYFQAKRYSFVEPLPIKNQGGTTLFPTAGVQIFDKIIHHGDALPEAKFFIAQPVVKTQFLDKLKEGFSTSFINIATEIVNPSLKDHFNALDDWLNLLLHLGFKKSDFYFFRTSKDRKWGNIKFTSEDIRVRYGGFSVGTAIWIPEITQENRPSLQISDIGFGLERIRWILNGGRYLDKLVEDKNLSAFDAQLVDCSRTLSLFAISGLEPSNNDQGYRFRKFSKSLVSKNIMFHQNTQLVIESFYDYWSHWIKNVTLKDEALEVIKKENQRNFNREILDRLGKKHTDVGIDINLPTEKVVKLLKGTSVSKDVLEKTLTEISGQ